MGRESKELIYKEGATEALSGTCYPPYARAMCQPREDARSPEGYRMITPEDNRLRLVPAPHDKVRFCSQLIKMGG